MHTNEVPQPEPIATYYVTKVNDTTSRQYLKWHGAQPIEYGEYPLYAAPLPQPEGMGSLREALQIGLEAQEECINLYVANYGEKYRPARLEAMRAGMKHIEACIAAHPSTPEPLNSNPLPKALLAKIAVAADDCERCIRNDWGAAAKDELSTIRNAVIALAGSLPPDGDGENRDSRGDPAAVSERGREISTSLRDVAAERERQDGKWGGAEHDDRHSVNDFVQLIEDYAGWARTMAGMDSMDKARRRLVQVAALAVAACECIDRATALAPPDKGAGS